MNKDELKIKYGDESILCVPNDKLEEMYSKCDNKVDALINTIAQHGYYDYRYNAELDFDARQVIPYVVLENDGKYFVTERIKGDERLVGKMSIAVGGHVDVADATQGVNTVDGAENAIINCIMRELYEETTADLTKGFEVDYYTTFVDDREDVSRVHVCLLTFVKLKDPNVNIKETEKLKGSWMTLNEVTENIDKFEGWSEVTVNIIKSM
jgi:predicted NUDIX family phosphoesterase